MLRVYGDPDWQYPLSLAGGVPVGVGVPLSRAPAVYEEQVKWALGAAEGEQERDRANYKSMAGFEGRVQELLEEEAAQCQRTPPGTVSGTSCSSRRWRW